MHNTGENMMAIQPYQGQGHTFAHSPPAYTHNQYNPNMQTLQGAPVGQTLQAMQEMRLQLQQQQQMLHQQQLQHMQEQIQQQQEMLKRITQMQPLPHNGADHPFQAQAKLAQQPVPSPLQMQEQPQPQLLQPQCAFQPPAFPSYGAAGQAMPAQSGADQAPSTQTLQAQLQQLQEQQSLVQQQLDTLQRPS
jgi:hypothetical protein